MKLKYILLVITATTVIISCKSNTKLAQLNHYKKVYKLAMTYGDYFAATNAIYHMWMNDTANAVSYKDTLANLYYKQGQYFQVIVLGKEVLAKHPDDAQMMGLVATADQNVNNLNESLSYYQKLYAKTHNLFQLYQIASIQFSLGRVDECNQTIDQVIADPNSSSQAIVLTVGQGQQQKVPYKAAVLEYTRCNCKKP